MLHHFIQLFTPTICFLCGSKGSHICESCSLSLIDPRAPHCYRCGALSEEWRTCTACRKRSLVQALISLGPYKDSRKKVIWGLKHSKKRLLAPALAALLVNQTGGVVGDYVVTHVPSANTRVRQRGFDHAKLLAKSYAEQQELQHITLLEREGSEQQTGKKKKERLLQAFSAYTAKSLKPFPKYILLIDDVVSSGATVEAAAYTLTRAGAKQVVVICIAHTL